MADSTKPTDSSNSRRNFLKIGAGVVAGAAVASVVEIPYYSSVIGSNNSNSSTTVSSLQSQLDATTSQLSDTQSSLSAAQGTISSLNSQLTSTQGQLSVVQSSLSSATSQNAALNQQLTSASTQISTLNQQVSTLSSQSSSLQANLDTETAFLILSTTEQAELAAITSTIIPTDSTGPGATEAGVVYFIDRQLKGEYGNSGDMFMNGPFIPAGTTSPVTVNGITYPGTTMNVSVAGTPYSVSYPPTANVRVGAGTRYQYAWEMKDFWRMGLAGIEAYANAAYGGNFETLSAADQQACLTDLWNNKPTLAQFNNILPSDFAYELFFMTWCGFTMDPVYGGNKGMVGWTYSGFNGTNQGNFYGEGYTTKQLMVMTTPVRLQPASLGQFQKGSP
ncbi:MAG: gluconate 2-dehydrogenase subunit 3 family protein [Nitrososphaerota archaeon]|nr:gluconate 2-dehydrogenase subunit 3 family protein [Nitrososphaerota archaeon]